MLFVFMVEDWPNYKLIVQLKTENPVLSENIIPILGPFNQQISYMHSIYKFSKGSGMADTLVDAGVIVGGQLIRHCEVNIIEEVYNAFFYGGKP